MPSASWIPDGSGAPTPTLGPALVPTDVIDIPGAAGAVLAVTREVTDDGQELALWAGGDGRAWRIDPETNAVTSIPAPIAGGGWTGIAFYDGDLWAADFVGERILRLDPATGRVLATLNTPKPIGFITGPGGMWTTHEYQHGFTHIDTIHNTIDGGVRPVLGTGAGVSSTWTTRDASSGSGREAAEIDAVTGKDLRVVAIPDGVGCTFLRDVSSREWTWCADPGATRVAMFDDSTGTLLSTFTTGESYIGGLADIGGETWAITGITADHPSRFLELGNNGPTGVGADLPPGLDPDGLIEAAGALWIPSEDGKLYRFDPRDVERLVTGHPPAH